MYLIGPKQLTPKQILIERLHHCNQCPHKRGSGFTAICTQCGCIIEAKTRLASSFCPLKIWTAVSTEEDQPKSTQNTPVKRGKCCGGQ